MKKIIFSAFFYTAMLFSFGQTTTKHTLIIFSGSDWCKPCIQLKSETLSGENLAVFFTQNAIKTYTADFPRKKRNAPSKEVIKHNEGLADKYNPEGQFPKIILVDAEGNLLFTLNGFITEDLLIKELKSIFLK